MNTAVRRYRACFSLLCGLLLPAIAGAQHFPPDDDLELMLRFLVEDRETTGIVFGVLEADGTTRILHYGSAGHHTQPLGPHSIFEIGSITKTFTATVLADMVLRGEVALEDPVAGYLPEHVSVPSRDDRQITLFDLATHTSGLPRLPENLGLGSTAGPYADYTIERLYSFLRGHELRRAPGERFAYSNLGYGLLAHALARAAGLSFPDLLRQRVLEPLGMHLTGYSVDGAAAEWLVRSHRFGSEVPVLRVAETMEGAGGLRSNAEDMLKYLAANVGPPGTPLERAMRLAHQIQVPGDDEHACHALAWRTLVSSRGVPIVWHGGSTPGSQARLYFVPERGIGTVLLTNEGEFRDAIGLHLLQQDAPPPQWERDRVAPDVLARYAGEYEETAGPGRFYVRLEDEGYLTFRPGTRVRARLYATSHTTFHLLRFPWSLTFREVEGGQTVELLLEVDERQHMQQGLTRSARKVRPTAPRRRSSQSRMPRR